MSFMAPQGLSDDDDDWYDDEPYEVKINGRIDHRGKTAVSRLQPSHSILPTMP